MNTYTESTLSSTQEMAGRLTRHIMLQSKPVSSLAHLFKSAHHTQLFIPNGSQLYSINQEVEDRISQLIASGNETDLEQELILLGLDAPKHIDDQPLKNPPLYALSLAIAQKCNMGCMYCYADQGDFGRPSKNMSIQSAFKAIDLLLRDCPEDGTVQLTFLGGEPLINRKAIREAVSYSATKAMEKNITVRYSITTNGTLLTEEDAVFFETHGFAVTVSLDGLKEAHDAQRPMKGGQGSFDRVMQNILPLLAIQEKMQVSARITVTPKTTNMVEALDEFIAMGFHSVGFSPLLRSSNGEGEMNAESLVSMLENMIACGLNFEKNALAGIRYPFLNMVNALKEISNGTHRPYPCGAGAGYMGVSADEELFACHRFVNEEAGYMGDLTNGIHPDKQNSWLSERHVHKQDPCTQCWARYLCSGGCHHEVIEKGRPACDYIRSWLTYTIQAHERLSRFKPGLFN